MPFDHADDVRVLIAKLAQTRLVIRGHERLAFALA
jgi:hypothetical protein